MKIVDIVMIMMRLRLSNDGSVIWIRDVSRPPVKQQRPLIMLILYHTDIQWDIHSMCCAYLPSHTVLEEGVYYQRYNSSRWSSNY